MSKRLPYRHMFASGMNTAQIARKCGVSEAQVYNSLHRSGRCAVLPPMTAEQYLVYDKIVRITGDAGAALTAAQA